MSRPQMLLILFAIATNTIVLQSQPLDDNFWRNIIDDTHKAGPYNIFCNRTEPTKEIPPNPTGDFYPCQLQCSCDPFTCGSSLPCCPDMPDKNVTFRNTSCLYPVIYTEPVDIFRHPKRHAEFPIRMIHGCDDEYIGSVLHEKCLDYINTTVLDYMLPVISNTTELVYVNRFCAECSDELKFTQFESVFACRNSLLNEEHWEYLALERTFENEIYLIQEGVCVYIFKLPDGRSIENHKCFQVDVNFCNESGDWDENDPYFETACGAYYLPYDSGSLVYRYYHCAVCNRAHDWSMPRSVCARIQMFVLRISFYALINMDQTDVTGFDLVTSENDKLLCGDGSVDVFDTYVNKCRRPLCQLFHVRKNDSCFPAYSWLDIQAKYVAIHFEEVNVTAKMVDPYRNFTTDVLSVVQKEIIEEMLNISPLTMQFYQKQGPNSTHESDFIIFCVWYSTSEEELVPKKVAGFFNPVFVNISLLHTSGYFKAWLVTKYKKNPDRFTPFIFQKSKYLEIFKYTDPSQSFLLQLQSILNINKILICKRVTLSRAEFNLSGDSLTLLSGDVIQLTQSYIVTNSQIHLCLDDYLDSSSISTIQEQNNSVVQDIVVILSFVCSIISIVCLLVTVVKYALLKPLRTPPGKINACLSVALLIAQIFQQFTMNLVEFPTACVVFGALIHLSWSATLFWMNVSSFNLFRIFSPRNIGHEVNPSLVIYSVYVVGMSSLLVVGNATYGYFASDYRNFGYGQADQPVCYISTVYGLLINFIAPVGAIILSNIVFLAITIWRIGKTQMPEGSHSNDRNNVLIYIKMSTLTGCCWLFGFIRMWTGAYVFEVLFILTNASQGLFLMLSFVCNKRVLSLLKDNFHVIKRYSN